MELRQLHTFRTAAKTLSFTRTASALSYAQSSVSAQVQRLEEELGVSLFDRLGRSLALTDAGQRLLCYANEMLQLADEAQVSVSNGEPAGAIVISAPETLCAYRLLPVLKEFRRRYPKVSIVFSPAALHEQYERDLSSGTSDAALLLDTPAHSEQLIIESLLVEPLRIVAHNEHPLARLSRVKPEDLNGQTLLLTERGCTYRTMFEQALAQAGTEPEMVMEFHSVEAIKQCVMGGIGVAVLPQVAIERELMRGEMTALAWQEPGFEIHTQMAWHKDKWLSPALRAFLSITREVLVA